MNVTSNPELPPLRLNSISSETYDLKIGKSLGSLPQNRHVNILAKKAESLSAVTNEVILEEPAYSTNIPSEHESKQTRHVNKSPSLHSNP